MILFWQNMIIEGCYMKKYITNKLKEVFTVPSVMFISYRGIPKEVNHGLINHDFWELYYVDRGDRNIVVEDTPYYLKTGQGIFYPPGQNHISKNSNSKSSNIVNISFICPNLDVDFFSNKIFTFNSHEKKILSDIINMGFQHYERVDNNPRFRGMRPRTELPPHVTHLIRASIEYLLLLLYNKQNTSQFETNAAGGNRQNQVSMLVQSSIEYMHANVFQSLTLEDIADKAKVSSSHLRYLFKKETGKTMMDYFNEIKIEKAKVLIFEDAYTLMEISDMLGFCTSSYFCKVFKKKADMTPTEFSKLVNPSLTLIK